MKTALIVLLALGVLTFGLVQMFALKRERSAARDYPPMGQLVDVDGVTVHAVQMGQGPDLVLLHGASGSTRDFTFAFVDLIKDRYRVTVLDRPGMGWSGLTETRDASAFSTGHATPREQARVLHGATQKLGVENPIVVGHSFGGIVAYAWALEFDDLAGMVSVAGVAMPWPGGLGWTYRLNGSALGGGFAVPVFSAFLPQSYVDNSLDAIFAPQDPPKDYLAYVGAAMSLRRQSMRANARQVNHLRPQVVEMSAQYGEINVPVELVHGDADTIVPVSIHSARIPDLIQGANLTVLPGIGHMPQHAAPQAVIDAIDRVATRSDLR